MIRRQKGFTLIEVLVALAVMAGGILMVSMTWSGNFMHIRKANLYNDVATLLERKMVEVEAKYQDKPLAEIPEKDDGDFEDHPQYRWEMESRDMKFPDISALLVGKDEGASEMLLSQVKQMIDTLNKSVKEVKVTIFVKSARGKELKFSASQYFVNYAQGGGGAPGIPQLPPSGGGG